MGTPQRLRRPTPEWKKELAKYDLKRMGLEILNYHIVFRARIEGVNLEGYKRRLLSSGSSSPYIAIAQSVIRVRYPDLGEYHKFLLGWEKEICEPEDEFGRPFNPIERAKWSNYHKSSIEALLLDWMYLWRKEIAIGKGQSFGGGTVRPGTGDSVIYVHKSGRCILIRPPMEGEANWVIQAIATLGPFIGYALDKYYYREAGIWRNIYKRRFKDKYKFKEYTPATKMFGRPKVK